MNKEILEDIRQVFHERADFEWLEDRACHNTPELVRIAAIRLRHGRNPALGAIMYQLLHEKMGYTHREFANSEAADADLQWAKMIGEITSDEIIGLKAYCNLQIFFEDRPYLESIL